MYEFSPQNFHSVKIKQRYVCISWAFLFWLHKSPLSRALMLKYFFFFYTITHHLLQLESFLEITLKSYQGQSYLPPQIWNTIQLLHFTCAVWSLCVYFCIICILSLHIHLTPFKHIHMKLNLAFKQKGISSLSSYYSK